MNADKASVFHPRSSAFIGGSILGLVKTDWRQLPTDVDGKRKERDQPSELWRTGRQPEFAAV
jgi:hypothetical protein